MKYAVLFTGIAGETQRVAVTDAAQLLSVIAAPDPARQLVGLLITCEDFNARLGMGGGIPTNGANPVGHLLYVGQALKLINSQQVLSLRVINAVAGSDVFLQITYEYEV